MQRRLVWTAVMSISIASWATERCWVRFPLRLNAILMSTQLPTGWSLPGLVIWLSQNIAAPRWGRVKGTSTEAKSQCISGLHSSWLACIRLLRVTTSCTRTTERILSELILLIHLSVGNDRDCLFFSRPTPSWLPASLLELWQSILQDQLARRVFCSWRAARRSAHQQ